MGLLPRCSLKVLSHLFSATRSHHSCQKQQFNISSTAGLSFLPPRISSLVSAPASVQARGKQLFQSLLIQQLLYAHGRFWCPALCRRTPRYVSEMQRTACRTGDGHAPRVYVSSKRLQYVCSSVPLPRIPNISFPFLAAVAHRADECELPVMMPRVSFLICECHTQVQHHLSIVYILFL